MTPPSPLHQPPSQWQLLRKDFLESLQQWPFWLHLGWQDLLRQYRRSFLGPTWIAINTAIFTAAFGWVGAQLFNQNIKTYIPYFCLGNIFFGFFTATLNDGCRTYMDASSFLKQASYPKLLFVMRVVWRNLLLLAHQIPLMLCVMAIGGFLGQAHWLLWLAGLAMSALSITVLVALLGLVSTRFRDIPMVVSSLLQIAFFITPVMWQPSLLSSPRAQLLMHLNPLAAWLELTRGPLMGRIPSSDAWITASVTLCVMLLVCAIAYRIARKRINYWL